MILQNSKRPGIIQGWHKGVDFCAGERLGGEDLLYNDAFSRPVLFLDSDVLGGHGDAH